MKTIVVTGAAGFIGSAVCRYLRKEKLAKVVGVDVMSYAATEESLSCLKDDDDFGLVKADIADAQKMAEIFVHFKPDAVMNLAAETHVDRSIDKPGDFMRSNIIGTFSLLETVRVYLNEMAPEKKDTFRFLHVSTDEVYGSLGDEGIFVEGMPYKPNSPYAASKACSDHLARAWFKTYDLPVVVSNCSNNYGLYQFPEKLIPLCINKALKGEKLPIYGKGENVRDWLFVEDHAKALYLILTEGRLGENYNVGGDTEKQNIDVVKTMCALLDEMVPDSPYVPHKNLITFVEDRPGHDARYAMDFTKLNKELGWSPDHNFDEGLRETVRWYLDNQEWCEMIEKRSYAGERLGVGKSANDA